MRIRKALILLFMGALLHGRDVLADDFYAQEKCSLCHIRQSVFFDPRFLTPEKMKEFDEERLCSSCHNGAVRDSRSSLWLGAQHPSQASPGGGPDGKRCTRCHSPHGKGGWDVLAGTSLPLSRGGDLLCAGCHKDRGSRTGGLHAGGFPEGGCRECHRAHGGVGKNLLRESPVALCLRCHPGKSAEKTGGHRTSRSSSAPGTGKTLPECASCHPVHAAGKGGDAAGARCAACHAMPGDRAEKGGKGHPSEERCLDCHSFHSRTGEGGVGLKGKDMRPGVVCGKCHAARVAESPKSGREKGTHVTLSPEGGGELCFRCHRIHGAAPGTRLLATAKSYSCLECHEGQNTISETAGIVLAHPVFERVAKGRLALFASAKGLPLGPAGEIVCRTCHSVHGASASTPLLARGSEGGESCFWCHEEMRGVEHLPAGVGKKGPDCAVCHPVHGKKEASVSADEGRTRIDGTEPWSRVCSSCHPRAGRHVSGIERGGTRRPEDMPGFDSRGRRQRTGEISCPTCHDPHGVVTSGKRLRRSYKPSGFLCAACHQDKETVALTPHDLRGIAGNSICEPCHVPHGGAGTWMWGMKPGPDGGKAEDACRSCHAEKGLATPMAEGGHPTNIIVPRPVPDVFPLFGAYGERGRKGVMTCATCHEAHGTGFAPMGQGTGKLLRAGIGSPIGDAGRKDACLPCHQGSGVEHGQADCIWCHPPHENRKAAGECGECHPGRDKGIVRLHAARGKGCGDCHRIHSGKRAGPPEAVCFPCHPKTERIEGTPHGDLGEGLCKPCHPAHDDLAAESRPRRRWEEVFPPDLPCLRCHGNGGPGPAPKWTDHPSSRKKVPTSYGATVTLETPIVMNGRLQEGGRPLFPLFDDGGNRSLSGRIGCVSCHDPHAGTGAKPGDPARTAGRYLRDPSGVFLADVCAPCHRGDAGERVRKFHELPRQTD